VQPPNSLPADFTALGKLLEEHRPRLLAVVRRRIDHNLMTRLDEDDIVNEAFLVAQRKWASFEQRSADQTFAWLYCIVRGCLIEAWRRETRKRRDPRRELSWPEQSSAFLGLGLASTHTTPSAAAMRREEEQMLGEALGALAESDREILTMRHFDCLTTAETAAALGITPKTAHVRYFRALQRLRALLQ
jgi:RNA polymerase sigma-70 factor, ECF subfamily